MKMSHIEIPAEFNRNAPAVQAAGAEKTGAVLIELACNLVGYPNLADKDVLDIGCGVRFTQTIINRDIPIKSYTGIDIDEPLINYLTNNVQDSRFSFYYWHIYNELYNLKGEKLSKSMRLPLSQNKQFDLIWMFSVITHNYPNDTESLLYIARKYIKKNGFLFFSAFIDNNIDTFEDREKAEPLITAYYNEKYLKQIIQRADWHVKSAHGKNPEKAIMNHFVCTPKYHFWEIF